MPNVDPLFVIETTTKNEEKNHKCTTKKFLSAIWNLEYLVSFSLKAINLSKNCNKIIAIVVKKQYK